MGVGLPNFFWAFFGPKTRFLPWYKFFFVNSPALIHIVAALRSHGTKYVSRGGALLTMVMKNGMAEHVTLFRIVTQF